jgi:hypothetical protein
MVVTKPLEGSNKTHPSSTRTVAGTPLSSWSKNLNIAVRPVPGPPHWPVILERELAASSLKTSKLASDQKPPKALLRNSVLVFTGTPGGKCFALLPWENWRYTDALVADTMRVLWNSTFKVFGSPVSGTIEYDVPIV